MYSYTQVDLQNQWMGYAKVPNGWSFDHGKTKVPYGSRVVLCFDNKKILWQVKEGMFNYPKWKAQDFYYQDEALFT